VIASNLTQAAASNATASEVEEASGQPWWMYPLLVVLLLLSAFFNGNNVGVLAMDKSYLDLLTKGPFETKKAEREAHMARKLLPMKERGLQILVMVLLMVAMTNSAVAIIMADIEGNLSGFLISTALIVIFGEILPQSLVTRHPLTIGYYSLYLMYFFFFVCFIICYPIAAILDKIFGEDEGNFLSKSRMKKMFEHYEKQNLLRPSERKILSAALELKTKSVGGVMTPLSKTYMLDINQQLDENLKRKIYELGYSRIPIYEDSKENIVGILMARDLILTNIDNSLFTIRQLSTILVRDVIAVDHKTTLEVLLTFLKRSHSHFAIVTEVVQDVAGHEPSINKVGIITLEDIIEEILQEEIQDERELDEYKGDRMRLRQRLVMVFSDRKANQVLSSDMLFAVTEYFQDRIVPLLEAGTKLKFGSKLTITEEMLDFLIGNGEILDIESDDAPFSHKILDKEIKHTEEDYYKNKEQRQFYQYLAKIEGKAVTTKDIQNSTLSKKIANVSNQQHEMPLKEIVESPSPNNLQEDRRDAEMRVKQKYETNEVPSEDSEIPEERFKELEADTFPSVLNPILYVRNVPSDCFHMILEGHVLVCSG
jgi:CBS domain containing-hemolysin-like protein